MQKMNKVKKMRKLDVDKKRIKVEIGQESYSGTEKKKSQRPQRRERS
jgi:hypothetical protein